MPEIGFSIVFFYPNCLGHDLEFHQLLKYSHMIYAIKLVDGVKKQCYLMNRIRRIEYLIKIQELSFILIREDMG